MQAPVQTRSYVHTLLLLEQTCSFKTDTQANKCTHVNKDTHTRETHADVQTHAHMRNTHGNLKPCCLNHLRDQIGCNLAGLRIQIILQRGRLGFEFVSQAFPLRRPKIWVPEHGESGKKAHMENTPLRNLRFASPILLICAE